MPQVARPSHEAAQHLSRVCPRFAALIGRVGPPGLRVERGRGLYEALIRAIAHQQLHGKAAEAILARFVALYPDETFPSPDRVFIGGGGIGLPYTSFLLGLADSASVPSLPTPFYRKVSWGLYLQDTWKITRKLTLDYGLRWDLQHAPEEVHYRNSMFGPNTPNPSAGGLLGGQAYEGYGAGRCNCTFTGTYPYAIGPRIFAEGHPRVPYCFLPEKIG